MSRVMLEKYVTEQLGRGHSVYRIREHLLEHGHDVSEVDRALQKAKDPPMPILKLLGETLGLIMLMSLVAFGFIHMYQYHEHFTLPNFSIAQSTSQIADVHIVFELSERDAIINFQEVKLRLNDRSTWRTSCKGTNCFDQVLRDCKPGWVTVSLDENTIYKYDILGPKEQLCEVRSGFIAHANIALLGKEMSCLVNPRMGFPDAMLDTTECEGSLWELITTSD